MKQKIIIGWLYPELMSIYGDRGNIIALQKRLEWRGIGAEVKRIGLESTEKELTELDLVMMGGAQDSQQTIVAKDLKTKKSALSSLIESGIPGIYVCGGFQFLGHYYREADGTVIEQLGVLDVYTENPGSKRLIGNVAIEVTGIDIKPSTLDSVFASPKQHSSGNKLSLSERVRRFGEPSPESRKSKGNKIIFVGFENHGGRTILGKGVKPLGKVLAGFGSNAKDGQEGAVYKNSIGTYFHGPILPKNPELTDFLLTKALELKYKQSVVLKPLDDSLAKKARNSILEKLDL